MVKITLFGLGGTGKSTIAKLFCNENDFVFMSSGNIYREMAAKKGMNVYEFNQFCLSNSEADIELDNKIKDFGEENDDFVFESRLAWYFIPDSIKIKLVCDSDVRCKRIQERDGGDIEEIKAKTIKREKSELKRYKELYGIKKYHDDEHFDTIIDTTNLTPERIVEKIEDIVENYYD